MINFGLKYAALVLRRAARIAGMVLFTGATVAVLMALLLI